MEKRTIGAFLAVLRKANGMTQQQVADRLNVSNKTVSKWECDESLPDITLIPALAEMFHVTADEILRGQRLEGKNEAPEKAAEKTEAQARSLIARTMAKHLNGLTIAAAILAAGMIALFTVSYAFYRPVLGFGIYLVLLLGAQVVSLLSFNTARTAIIGGGLLEEEKERTAVELLLRRTMKLMEAGAATVVFAAPLILIRSDVYTHSVVNASTYLELLPVLLPASVLVVLLTEWIFTRIRPEMRARRMETGRRLKRLYLGAGCALALFLMLAFASMMHAGSKMETRLDLDFQVEFDDEAAAREYQEMADDYAQGGNAWKEYCRENLQERGLPWKGSIDDYTRDELTAHEFLGLRPELAEDNLIDFGYGWAFMPDMMSIQGTGASFHIARYHVGDSAAQGFILIAALLATVVIAAAVILRRKSILAEADARRLTEAARAEEAGPEAEE